MLAGIHAKHLLSREGIRTYEEGYIKQQKAVTEVEWQDKIHKWIHRGFKELSYCITHVPTGHGRFNKYLAKTKRTNGEECPDCEEVDDMHYTMLKCPRWAEQWASMTE